MWIVRLALRRPYTFVVLALLLLILGPLVILNTPTDIFPNIDIPVVSVIWRYTGFNAQQMSDHIVTLTERSLTTTVDDIEHIESQSLDGTAVVKIFFQPDANINKAIAQVTAVSQTQVRQLPAGTTPPLVITYNASTVPILQLALSGKGLSEQELNDYALNFLRTRLVTVRGVAIPYPYGGKQRQVQVDLNTSELQAKGLSPVDVVNAISAQNLILPSGSSKIGSLDYNVDINGSPDTIQELNDLPLKRVGDTTLYIHDVANVRDGSPPQTNIVRVNGQRASLLTILKAGNASTLDVINGVKTMLAQLESGLPAALKVHPLADQSLFVRASINGVLREATIAAVLTALMILIFLGSWRSTLIIAISIPLSILTSIVVLSALGQTINIMTLGGLALAVGVLVDEATVEVENIHTQLLPGTSRAQAVVEACKRTIIARLLSMLCVLAVFVPSFFMSGVGRQLFVPLSLAVGFAMIASYLLSSSLVPVFAIWIMKEAHGREESEGFFGKVHSRYESFLEYVEERRWRFVLGYFALAAVILALAVPHLGTEIFPDPNGPVLRLRLKAPIGTRIEETEPMAIHALDLIRRTAGPQNVDITTDYVGVQPSSYPVNLIHLFTSGPEEVLMQVQLRKSHPDDERLREDLRAAFKREMPQLQLSFEAGDIISQVMSFGSPTPVQIDVQGVDLDQNYAYLAKIEAELRKLTFLRDISVVQQQKFPTVEVNIDRQYAGQFGLSMADVSNSMIAATGSSRFTTPNYWRDPRTGNGFQIQVQLPPNRAQGVPALSALPLMKDGRAQPQLDQVAKIEYGAMPEMIERFSGQRVVSVTANLHGITLGDAQIRIQKLLRDLPAPPKGSTVIVRGEMPALQETVSGLRIGLLLAIATIFLLLMANFQSVRLPLAVLSTIPGVLTGVVLMLLLTGTTLNIQSFMGAIMAVGISVANSILLVSFAEHARHEEGTDRAAHSGALGRLRAILMTASAMIAGMIPMAIGFGEGGPEAAPLGRAVIGGLIFSTFTTLLILPAIYSLLQKNASTTSNSLNPLDPESQYHVQA
jgi:multidrug efflux pump subunit AcrB